MVNDSWAVNTYVACDIRCTCCITSARGSRRRGIPAALVKQQLIDELDAIGSVDRVVVASYCAVYPSPERSLRVTRVALEVLVDRGLPFRLVTKGPTVVPDAD